MDDDLRPTPVVFVHGWAGSAESWWPIVARLDLSIWTPTTLRLPGSRGAQAGDPFTVPGGADLLMRTLQALPGPAVLVGHSMGAQITLLAHADQPQRVLGEVVVDPAYGAEAIVNEEMSRWADRIRRDGHAAVREFFTAATATMSASDARQVLDDLEATPAEAIASYLMSEYVDAASIGRMPQTRAAARGRIRPVLSLHSTDASAAREASLPSTEGARSHVWKGHGHYLHLEAPDRFVALLDEWWVKTNPQR